MKVHCILGTTHGCGRTAHGFELICEKVANGSTKLFIVHYPYSAATYDKVSDLIASRVIKLEDPNKADRYIIIKVAAYEWLVDWFQAASNQRCIGRRCG